MQFVIDPPTSVKIRRMQERVRWQAPPIANREIDQTRLVIDGESADPTEFSFLVVGDSGSGYHRGDNPQRRVAEQMLPHYEDSRFVLHTGDVIYLVGSSEYYPPNFIEPYRELLVGGDRPSQIAYDQMVFNRPFFPVPGNHDYYNLPAVYGLLAQLTWPLRHILVPKLGLDIGWHGSGQGKAYAKAFLDYLMDKGDDAALSRHLDQHYTAQTETGRCLRYEPHTFTRLPNRYYTFRVGGIDFFALDSNTFNTPLPIPATPEGREKRRSLKKQREELEQQRLELLAELTGMDDSQPEGVNQVGDLQAKLEQIEEVKIDIDKQLAADPKAVVDVEQLDWLRQRLVQSWQNPAVRGRVIFFHHPPYVTEATKWKQAQTLAIRYRLREVLDAVQHTVQRTGDEADRPLVDLILNGHAHCLEHLRTGDTGHADSHLDWIVCGGSGFSLRRQRREGPELYETADPLSGKPPESADRAIAKSHLFVGRNGRGSKKRRPYSCLRIDVQAGTPPKFVVRPFVAERFQDQWNNYALDPFEL